MDHFDAFLSYYNCELDIQAFFGTLYSDGYVTVRGPSGNSRFYFAQGFGNPGGYAYFNLIFFPMMSMLAPRFKASLAPYIVSRTFKEVKSLCWTLETSRNVNWTHLRSIIYPDGVKVMPIWLAAMFNEVFIAYFAMGDATWQYGSGIKFCTNSFQPSCLAILQAVLRRYGISTVASDDKMMKCGRMGRVLFIRKGDTASILRMQDIARHHFCPEMMYRVGLNPDGTPFLK